MIAALAGSIEPSVRLRFDLELRSPTIVLRDPSAPVTRRGFGWFGLRGHRYSAIQAARAHDLLLIDVTTDGPQPVDVIVDEPLPKHLLERAWLRVDDLGLRVPSGRIVAGGLENFGRPNVRGAAHELPAGGYAVTVLAPDWSLDEPPLGTEENERVGYAILLTNALLAFAAVVALVILVVGLLKAWRGSLIAAAGSLLVAWFAAMVINRPRRGERARMRRAANESRYPAVVLRLQRLEHNEDVLDLRAGYVDLNRPIDRPLPALDTVH